MTERNVPQTPPEETPETAAANQDQIESLVGRIEELAQIEQRHWKITAWVFAILCIVIAGYLTIVYKKVFSQFTSPDWIAEQVDAKITNSLGTLETQAAAWLVGDGLNVARDRLKTEIQALPEKMPALTEQLNASAQSVMASLRPNMENFKDHLEKMEADVVEFVKEKAPDFMETQGRPYLERARDQLSAKLDELAEKATAEAPDMINEHLVPQLAEWKGQLPEYGRRMVEDLKEDAPHHMDMLRDHLVKSAIPYVRKQGTVALRESFAEAKAEMQKALRDATLEVARAHKEHLAEMDNATMVATLEKAMEEQMGWVFDKYMPTVEEILYGVSKDVSLLVEQHEEDIAAFKQGDLAPEQGADIRRRIMEYRFIQVWKALLADLMAALRAQQS